jgi:hypothetical protein
MVERGKHMTMPELLGYVKLLLDTFGVTPYISAVVGVIVVITGVTYVVKTLRGG